MQYQRVLQALKHHWSTVSDQYPATNNEVALIVRAIAEVCCPASSDAILSQTAITDQLEQIIPHFPESLAPLCRDLAQTCLKTIRVN